MVNLIVIKRNKEVEKFNSNKIIIACKAAGASEEIAKRVASEITDEFSKLESSRVRELALQKLNSFAPEVANSWRDYDVNMKKR